MKISTKKQLLVICSLILLISITLPISTSCEPTHKINIENGTEQDLTIYCDTGPGDAPRVLVHLEPGENISRTFWFEDGCCLIEARNSRDEVILLKEYEWQELRDMNWEVVITLPEDYCDYTKFVIEEDDPCLSIDGHATFSFEYPKCFNELKDCGFPQITSVYFTKEGTGEFRYRTFYRMGVTVYRDDLFGPTDAQATIEDTILEASTRDFIEDFQILDRSSITIAGLTAEYVYYSYHTPSTPRDYREWDTLVKYVCFVHDGFLWQIDFEYGPVYDEASLEEVEAWFDHLIETFEILEQTRINPRI